MDIHIAQEVREHANTYGQYAPEQDDHFEAAQSPQPIHALAEQQVARHPLGEGHDHIEDSMVSGSVEPADRKVARTDVSEASTKCAQTEANCDLAQIVARRDGQRPQRFVGASIVNYKGDYKIGAWSCSQEVELFHSRKSDRETLFLALSLHPPKALGLRPIYDCYQLEPENLQGVLHKWFQRIRARIPPGVSSKEPKAVSINTDDLTTGFHTMTGHCFLSLQVPTKRNEICLQ